MAQFVAWGQVAPSQPLFWRWLLWKTLATTVPVQLCFHWGAGVLGLVVFAISAFLWPIRVTLDSGGVTLKSLAWRTRWPADTVDRIFVEIDSRTLAWPRRPVLVIQRGGRPAARLFGSAQELTELARAATELGLGRLKDKPTTAP